MKKNKILRELLEIRNYKVIENKEKTIIKAFFFALLALAFCYYLGSECAKKDLKYTSER